MVLASILPTPLCQNPSPSLNCQVQHVSCFVLQSNQISFSAGRFWGVYGVCTGAGWVFYRFFWTKESIPCYQHLQRLSLLIHKWYQDICKCTYRLHQYAEDQNPWLGFQLTWMYFTWILLGSGNKNPFKRFVLVALHSLALFSISARLVAPRTFQLALSSSPSSGLAGAWAKQQSLRKD